MNSKKNYLLLLAVMLLSQVGCSKSGGTTTPPVVPPVVPPVTPTNDMDCWLTKSDQTILLQKQTAVLSFVTTTNSNVNIEVDSAQRYQAVEGFGYTLTGGSAYVINRMEAAAKASLLQELFGTSSGSIGVNYLRISIGASDLNATTFTYDDVPSGQTDVNLAIFSLNPDKTDLIPLLKEILAINPNIKILATPWSAPVWMKDNNSFKGGSLVPANYNVYAQYFVKYIQQMKSEGITIDAITPQNEPLNPNNNPSLVMTALQQADFIKSSLGPAFQTAGITTKIITYDHNCDVPNYPLTVLQDAQANPFVSGSAFHLYAGDISALSTVHNAYPDKSLYFTEQYTASTGDFGGDLKWHVKNVLIGSMRNWSRTALEWNLANDGNYGPHTDGGCTTCKGALTITGSSVSRNVAYYIIAHASKFVPFGSIRIASTVSGNLQTVAFQAPDNKKILIAENDGVGTISFNIKYNGKWVATQLAAGAVATYIW
ncbi:glycoside hydrolase family 30 beta sandwich domain-containing protein [Ferruginibacter paludis]|uniref:glycoside hydrolase family 30 protein n=1 Tax=Ferruginibacter paludis TaxID=1310417 RepID=UPI0025B337AA|nr:glycoside hydrolase family 30 beta sandwich domain-containing protein [Ferruginibacter paludis]MDN3657730.1 glycoside hydrolase family 30 beta sandwich domain-containing protein [Ferruginibacter paludis]